MNFTTHGSQLKSQISNGKSQSSESSLVDLILIGLATQMIYVTYIIAFPLVSNTRAGGPAADLEILMRHDRWFAPIYTLGILLLYYLFWQAMKIVEGGRWKMAGSREQGAGKRGKGEGGESQAPFKGQAGHDFQQDRETQAAGNSQYVNTRSRFTFHGLGFTQAPDFTLKLFILGFGLIFGLTLVWLYPITANDLFRYVVRGRVWAVHGESPLISPPDKFPDDPYLAFAGEFADSPSAYGPLWELIVQVPLRFGATDIVPGVISLKLMLLLCYLLLAILLGWVAIPEKSSSLTALTFFAWNPLILMQGLGNGHNDLVFMLLMVVGLILWQRQRWWLAALALTLATLAKAPALLLLPLFGVSLLRGEPTWRQRLSKGLSVVLIGLITAYLVYAVFGPISETLQGVEHALTDRRGFAIASGLRMVLREVIPRGAEAAIDPSSIWGVTRLREALPCQATGGLAGLLARLVPCDVPEQMPRTTARYIFLLFYAWLLLQLWRNKLNLVTAGFLAYFSQLMLARTFRIWYPMWLIPLAALHLTPATFWSTLLFGLTAELSIINYFVVWRWWLRNLPWAKVGLLARDFYWPVMHILTVPWLFGIPLFGPIIMRRWAEKRLPPFGSSIAQTTQVSET